ncbi:hypothetical protein O181_051803 [Austropuccinia psidii MF-1]|uniref:Uncharacterized protein n=1 Tax=Austropuccinia psidii MF-1 TaxID=1389203 RepID=A0A9Q3E1I7_9BASI|nr:hypothetical protein [Austropuccinia psidii MF-1]
MKASTALMEKIVKMLQEGHGKLSKATEETNKKLNIVFEEQHHSKRDRNCLDQDINQMFNFYHSLNPQPQGHVTDNTYHQEDIKTDAMLVNKTRSPSQYHNGDNMSSSQMEHLKQIAKVSIWPKFSGTGEYDHMKLIDYIDGIFMDVPSIPDFWITVRINTAFQGHARIWYTARKEIHGRRNWPWWKIQIIQKYSSEHYANNCPKKKEKVYAIEKFPEEESPTDDSELNCMGDAIREQSDKKKPAREEFIVEYQEEKLLQIQDIQLEAGMKQDIANINL